MDAHRDFIEAASGKPVIISGRFERGKAEKIFSTSNVLEFPEEIKNLHI